MDVATRARSELLFQAIGLALVCATAISAQNTIIVQGDAGAYRRALLVANHGDALLVRAGSYEGAITSRGVRVLCDDDVVFTGSAPGVQSLIPGKTFVLRGGRSAVFANGIDVLGCTGAVVIEGYRVDPSAGSFGRPCNVVSSAHVAFHACVLNNVNVVDSTVSLAGCMLTPGCCYTDPLLYCGLGMVGGNVALSDCSVRAKPGVESVASSPGIWFNGGELTIAGSPGSYVEGGYGLFGARNTPAIVTVSPGTIRLQPSVQLRSISPPITGPATVIALAIPSVSAPSVPSGTTFTARVHGANGSLSVLLASALVRPRRSLAGDVWIDPSAEVLDVGLVPASGHRWFAAPLPPIPPGVTLAFQPASFLVDGTLLIGAPAIVAFR